MHTKKKSVTLADIAMTVGVSKMTVSRALNGYPHVNKSVRNKILDTAKIMGYRPNAIARSLVLGESFQILFVAKSFSHKHFSSFLTGIEKVISKSEYQLTIKRTQRKGITELEVLYKMEGNHPAGILFDANMERLPEVVIDKLTEFHLPVVVINHPDGDCPFTVIKRDYKREFYRVIRFLEQRRLSRYLYFTSGNNSRRNKEWIAGTQEAVSRRDSELRGEVIYGISTFSQVKNAVNRFSDEDSCAIIVDQHILRLILRERTFASEKWGNDVLIVSLDESRRAHAYGVSYIQLDGEQMGIMAAKQLFNQMQQKNAEPRVIKIAGDICSCDKKVV